MCETEMSHLPTRCSATGPIDLVSLPSFLSKIEIACKSPLYARFLRRLASFSRRTLMDRRGTGLSDHARRLSRGVVLAERKDTWLEQLPELRQP